MGELLQSTERAKGAAESAEKRSTHQAPRLEDLALTAADWAKHKGLGEEAVKLAMSYAMDASRRMGELLQATERNKGEPGPGRGKPRSDPAQPFPDSKTPTLQELGITRKESSRAQKLAALPEETFEELKQGKTGMHDGPDPDAAPAPAGNDLDVKAGAREKITWHFT